MLKSTSIILLSVFLSLSVHAQEKINWLTWEEALELHSEVEKKFFVDIYTDWCKYCDKMEKTTLSDPKIVEFLNQNYYSIHFNAEDKGEIIFNNKSYEPIKSFGKRPTHELAIELMEGNLGYPTIVFVDENLKVIQPLQGFQDVRTFKMIMSYFAGDFYKSMHWKPFVNDYDNGRISLETIRPSEMQPKVQTVGNSRR